MKKFQYSKILPIVTGLIFIGSVVCATLFSGLDTAVYVSAIGISGSVFGSSIIFYLKKAQVENTYQIKISLYQESAKARLFYNEQMMILKDKYSISDLEASEIDSEGNMDELMDRALVDAIDTVDDSMNEATSPIELQS